MFPKMRFWSIFRKSIDDVINIKGITIKVRRSSVWGAIFTFSFDVLLDVVFLHVKFQDNSSCESNFIEKILRHPSITRFSKKSVWNELRFYDLVFTYNVAIKWENQDQYIIVNKNVIVTNILKVRSFLCSKWSVMCHGIKTLIFIKILTIVHQR